MKRKSQILQVLKKTELHLSNSKRNLVVLKKQHDAAVDLVGEIRSRRSEFFTQVHTATSKAHSLSTLERETILASGLKDTLITHLATEKRARWAIEEMLERAENKKRQLESQISDAQTGIQSLLSSIKNLEKEFRMCEDG